MRKRKLPPDTRLDWRDLNMPVLNKYGKPVPHEKMQLKAKMALAYCPEPDYRSDPTYHMRKPK